MKIQRQNGTLSVQDLQELSAANARSFPGEICASELAGLKHVEIDLSKIHFVDGYGLGALAALYVALNKPDAGSPVIIRLLHPQPPVQQVLELARLHHIFEIIPRNGVLTDGWRHPDVANGAPESK